ncbi:hypothetical protein BGX30_011381 [Mortierella sp. GBA39]|nr:hypothetical protein BGX30_011381 [Mortierella sp. GBA39]
MFRSMSIFFVIIDAFPNSTTVQELIFPMLGMLRDRHLSVPGDNLKIRVPRPRIINCVFFFLLFGPFLLDLPSVISSGTFLSRSEYTSTNIAIAVHFITLGGVILIATAIFFFTLNQLTNAIAEYTVPSELTLVHVGVTQAGPDGTGGQTFTLSPLPESEKEDGDVWDTSLTKVRHRLMSIRNAGTVMLLFYVFIYVIYGVTRPLIHQNIVWNVFFCIVFNLDPGTPTIFAYFIFSIIHHVNSGPPALRQVYSIPRPPIIHIPSSRPSRRLSDSFLFDLHRSPSDGSRVDPSLWSPSKDTKGHPYDLFHLDLEQMLAESQNPSPVAVPSSAVLKTHQSRPLTFS